MTKKRRPPKRARAKRQKRYDPDRGGANDIHQARGFMHGIARGLRAVAGNDGATRVEVPTGRPHAWWVPLVGWAIVAGAAAYALSRFFQ